MAAVNLAVKSMISAGLSNCHIIIKSDNVGVVGALAAGRSQRCFTLSPMQQWQIDEVVLQAWSMSTIGRYSAYVNQYLAFCTRERIPSQWQFLAAEDMLCLYALLMARAFMGRTVANKISGLYAWHIQYNLL